jgi:hypothetical protein
MDGSTMSKGKVTFAVHEMLLGKEETNAVLENIDMNSIPYEPQTTTWSEISGGDALRITLSTLKNTEIPHFFKC